MTLRAYAAIAFLCGGLTACLARTRAEDPLPGPQQDAAVVADAATSERRVVASAYVPVPPWEAWDWIASSDRLDQWLAQEVALDVIVGGPVRLVSDGVVTEGSISAVDEPTSMAWSLSASGGAQRVVTFRVSGEIGGARIYVDEGPFPADAAGEATAVAHRRRWNQALSVLRAAVMRGLPTEPQESPFTAAP
ncbi:MAG: SRPBCC domain-containing protein [Planctomycetes bacterium]|nr:SRPBCC domain-containing protein [Planctomycetota bacterium]MCC7170713.1 SRPBCC domain-containing protein [Planctomycetota bacterium]